MYQVVFYNLGCSLVMNYELEFQAMARSKSDISNSAIRIFLQKVGSFYDEARGFEVFKPTKDQKQELLDCFNNMCCFCGATIDLRSLSQDHLVPMNKEHLGLHAWGNVVPCCKNCNNEKQQKDWLQYLESKCNDSALCDERAKCIRKFVKSKKYDSRFDLHEYAGNLYQDIGEVAMTLIDLRYAQAADAIKRAVVNEQGD